MEQRGLLAGRCVSVGIKRDSNDLLEAMDRMEFMLRFTLANADLDKTIAGTRIPQHLDQNVEAALEGPLPDDVMGEAMRRLHEAGSHSAQ